MNCETARQHLGEFFDGEAPPDLRREIESHLVECCVCARELVTIRNLAAQLAAPTISTVPAELWSAIEPQLPRPRTAKHSRWFGYATPRRFAIAASFLAVVGVGTMAIVWSKGGASQASAATIDFGSLLDELARGPENAFETFVKLHEGRAIPPDEAVRTARNLDFDLPLTLPGGFRLQGVFLLRFDGAPGIAASYTRGTEFLATIFHATVKQEDFGTHKDYPCVVGKHRGHRVEVGEWKLVHLTDATTCHCVLSKLDEARELPLVFAKIAPNSKPDSRNESHSHIH